MLEKLKEVGKNSYSPYSHFRVATIVIMKDGTEFKGVNVENAAYGASVCAERSAILSAVSNGYKYGDFKENKLFKEEFGFDNQFLHAKVIKFKKIDGHLSYLSNKKFIAEMPSNMKDILNKLD